MGGVLNKNDHPEYELYILERIWFFPIEGLKGLP